MFLPRDRTYKRGKRSGLLLTPTFPLPCLFSCPKENDGPWVQLSTICTSSRLGARSGSRGSAPFPMCRLGSVISSSWDLSPVWSMRHCVSVDFPQFSRPSLTGLAVPWWVTVAFLGGVIVPYAYMVTLVFWMPPTPKAKLQYIVGLLIYILTGPFMTIAVLLYTSWHLDSFGWGKTRQVISEDSDSSDDEKALSDEESTVGLQTAI